MSYYIKAKLPEGELIQVSMESLVAGEGEIVKVRQGEIPDLTRYSWEPGSLAFIESNAGSLLSRLQFMRRFTNGELEQIYTLAKTVIAIEIWLEKFKMAAEIDLNDPDIVAGVHGLEAMGIIGAGRAVEVLG
jgi:hypothetical protein